MWHQGLNCNFMKLWDYFSCTKKIKTMTLFNNLSPPRHPIVPFWRVSTERKQHMLFCFSCATQIRFLHCLCFDLNENNVSVWRSWHRTAYVVYVCDTLQNGARVTRSSVDLTANVFIHSLLTKMPFSFSHILVIWIVLVLV